jgi:hypothetical protein
LGGASEGLLSTNVLQNATVLAPAQTAALEAGLLVDLMSESSRELLKTLVGRNDDMLAFQRATCAVPQEHAASAAKYLASRYAISNSNAESLSSEDTDTEDDVFSSEDAKSEDSEVEEMGDASEDTLARQQMERFNKYVAKASAFPEMNERNKQDTPASPADDIISSDDEDDGFVGSDSGYDSDDSDDDSEGGNSEAGETPLSPAVESVLMTKRGSNADLATIKNDDEIAAAQKARFAKYIAAVSELPADDESYTAREGDATTVPTAVTEDRSSDEDGAVFCDSGDSDEEKLEGGDSEADSEYNSPPLVPATSGQSQIRVTTDIVIKNEENNDMALQKPMMDRRDSNAVLSAIKNNEDIIALQHERFAKYMAVAATLPDDGDHGADTNDHDAVSSDVEETKSDKQKSDGDSSNADEVDETDAAMDLDDASSRTDDSGALDGVLDVSIDDSDEDRDKSYSSAALDGILEIGVDDKSDAVEKNCSSSSKSSAEPFPLIPRKTANKQAFCSNHFCCDCGVKLTRVPEGIVFQGDVVVPTKRRGTPVVLTWFGSC